MSADNTYPAGLQLRQDGNAAVSTGKSLDIESGAALKVAGTDITAALAAAVTTPVAGVAAGYKVARGQATTASASDTVVTGLASVVAAVANLEDAPVIGCDRAQAVIGDQAGTPAAGSILIKTFKPTATNDATPVTATTTGKKVNWIAVGT